MLSARRPLFVATLATTLALSALAGRAEADGIGTLGVTPTRVVFEGRERSREVVLLNRGPHVTTYRIFFVQRRMREDGSFEEISEPGPGEQLADSLLRYAPRQVTIPAFGSQSVRLLVRKPADLAPGEYRSHLVFQELPARSAGESLEPAAEESGEIQVKLVPIFAVSIPVIVRHTELQANVRFAGARLERSTKQGEPSWLELRLDREGDRSVYGELAVRYTSESGAETQVGLLRGVAIYTPNAYRNVRIRIEPPSGVELEHGSLAAVFREPESQEGAVLAEAAIPLP